MNKSAKITTGVLFAGALFLFTPFFARGDSLQEQFGAIVEKGPQGLKDKDSHKRLQAVQVLGMNYDNKKYAKDFSELLKDKDPQIRSAAIQTLGRWDEKEYTKEIIPFLKDQAPSVRASAAEALGFLHRDNPAAAREYAHEIAVLLKDKDALVRRRAVAALGLFKLKEYTQDVVPLLDDPSPDVRGSAALALFEFGAKEYAKKYAERSPQGENPEMQGEIVQLLGLFGSEDDAIKIAGHALKDPDARVREKAVKNLHMFMLNAGLQNQRKRIWTIFMNEGYVREVIKLLNDKDSLVRLNARNALSGFKQGGYKKDIGREIAALLKDQDTDIQCAALEALEKNESVEYIDEVRKLSDEKPVTKVSTVATQLLKKWENKN